MHHHDVPAGASIWVHQLVLLGVSFSLRRLDVAVVHAMVQ